MDEKETRRKLIDAQLNKAGWKADTENINYTKGYRPKHGENVAIAEYPTSSGPADYILFTGLDAIGAVEAKKDSTDIPGDIGQAQRYSKDFQALHNENIINKSSEYKIPFAFSSNGRDFSEALPTKSGIWFADLIRSTPRRPLRNWYTPQGLKNLLNSNINFSQERLKKINFGSLRDYQINSIKCTEEAIIKGKRECLLSLATGTGKTIISLFLMHRLLSSKLCNRILFVVDRKSLATQAMDKFSTIEIEYGNTLNKIYNIAEPSIKKPDLDTQIHIVTIQGLIKRVLYGNSEDNLKIDDYDCIIVDECHRGYFLDKEMDQDEIHFDSHENYFSSYKKCINYFDAIKIGITATPAVHTVDIFGKPIFNYSYREGVIDGWLIDHEPPYRLYTKLSKYGIRWKEGEKVKFVSSKDSSIKDQILEDELNFGPNEFNKLVITRNFNKAIAETMSDEIDPSLDEKSLFFAVNDNHADILVDELKKAFVKKYGSIKDNSIEKITGSIDRPENMIKKFQFDKFPNIAVTVDLLTTGIDIHPLCNLIFVRNVNSRILFEQMLGRATRPCPEIKKESFRVFDTIGVFNSLGEITDMKPVVKEKNKKIDQILTQINQSKTEHEFNFFKDELLVKLNAKKRFLTDITKNKIKDVFDQNISEIINEIKEESKNSFNLSKLEKLNKIFDENEIERYIPVSEHVDKTIEVSSIIKDPSDYIKNFNDFINQNKNKVEALKILSTSPKSFKKSHLKEISIILSEKGFKEKEIQYSYKITKNIDVTARIIGFIRQASIGDPLLPYEKRVKNAIENILNKKDWTKPQITWLKRIANQIIKETIVDNETFDDGAFKDLGGFNYLNKVFDNNFSNLMKEINEEIWKAS